MNRYTFMYGHKTNLYPEKRIRNGAKGVYDVRK